jgi:hypothetical protein
MKVDAKYTAYDDYSNSGRLDYMVNTNFPAVKIEFVFNFSDVIFTLYDDGDNNFFSGFGVVSGDRQTWNWKDDRMDPGDYTVTITAYDEKGYQANTTLDIHVDKVEFPEDPVKTPEPKPSPMPPIPVPSPMPPIPVPSLIPAPSPVPSPVIQPVPTPIRKLPPPPSPITGRPREPKPPILPPASPKVSAKPN